MTTHYYPTITAYLEDNRPFLERNETVNNLVIGIPSAYLNGEKAMEELLLAAVKKEGQVVLSAVQTPGQSLLLSLADHQEEEATGILARDLFRKRKSFDGLVGPKTAGEAFARHWQALSDRDWTILFRTRIYQLDRVLARQISLGKMRLAKEEDLYVISKWLYDFDRETFDRANEAQALQKAREKIVNRQLYLWEFTGKPVSMAAWARPTRNGVSINYVYTPPEWRRRGFAGSLVTMLTERMLEQYRFCNLFTDAANPTSNAIYQRIGYRFITDFLEIGFH